MKKNIIMFFTVIFCFCLQSTVFRTFSFGGIGPNLLIIITAVFGFMNGKKTGTLIGFFCGLLMDIFFGSVLGFYALIYMYIGFVNGMFHKIFYPEDIKLPLSLIALSDTVYGIITYFLMFLLRSKFNFPFYFMKVILPEIVYTIVITIFLYPIILVMNKRFAEEEKRSAQKFV
ncbi:MAG: rod shape-determining protein MreD [Lachnospiraceae bacterium]|nr:rod shape-determining protein MreD [Lachnospiraceae bacterium]